jgi:hypothetical protein
MAVKLHCIQMAIETQTSLALRGDFIPKIRYRATTSLFAEQSISQQRGPSSFVISIVAHAAALGLLYFGLTHMPRIDDQRLSERYSVRQLDLHTIDPQVPDTPGSRIPYPGPYREAASTSPLGLAPELTEAMRSFLASASGRQTLVQAGFHSHLSLAERLPLPAIVIWTPELASSRRIVAPLPSPATASHARPSFELPNEEIRLADLGVASTVRSMRSEAVLPGTTSPLEVHSPNLLQMAPATTSDSSEQPTPTAVLALSDLRMKDGTVILPPVNEIAPASGSAETGRANPTAMTGRGAGDSAGRESESPDIAGKDEDDGEGNLLSTEHIVLPKNGRFGVVVVGSSLGEEYPETLAIWSNRVAYTAYLHVGLSKSWILQYSVKRSAEASEAGTVARLEAPWPYDIVRPNLVSRDLNANALMIHGLLNQAGRLESLAIAFPTRFRYASFVLHALQQWQFRPARQNGQATEVEVVLIIPDELE